MGNDNSCSRGWQQSSDAYSLAVALAAVSPSFVPDMSTDLIPPITKEEIELYEKLAPLDKLITTHPVTLPYTLCVNVDIEGTKFMLIVAMDPEKGSIFKLVHDDNKFGITPKGDNFSYMTKYLRREFLFSIFNYIARSIEMNDVCEKT
jgi:hypothetical protein